jgi:hypothetical protein
MFINSHNIAKILYVKPIIKAILLPWGLKSYGLLFDNFIIIIPLLTSGYIKRCNATAQGNFMIITLIEVSYSFSSSEYII